MARPGAVIISTNAEQVSIQALCPESKLATVGTDASSAASCATAKVDPLKIKTAAKAAAFNFALIVEFLDEKPDGTPAGA
jgi:hypothetical protein